MELLLVRHATAELRTLELEDIDRALTKRGIKRFTRSVGGLERLGLRIGDVYHSPWRRAVETARLLAPIVDGEMIATALLADDPKPALLTEITPSAAHGRIALVGHQPWMGELLTWLVTGSTQGGDNVVFKKGGVAWLEGTLQPGSMELIALYPNKALRMLAPDL